MTITTTFQGQPTADYDTQTSHTHHTGAGFLYRFPYALTTLLLLGWHTPSLADNMQCHYYAQDAVDAQQQNLQQQCNLTGKRWHNDMNGHQAWCVAANGAQRQAETNARQQALATCLTHKLDPTHADNQLRLPIACKDPSGLFKPQRWVVAWDSTQKQRYSPVKNAVISYDFNQDQRNDYIFLEQDTQHNVQVTTCLSANNYPQAGGFERILTDIQFYSNATFPADQRYYLQLTQDLLSVEISFFAHNEGSCNTKASYRYAPLKQGFDLIDSTASCAPHTIAGSQEPYPLVPPAIPKMMR
ncbi:MAG: hypothetical protein ACWA5U_06850 [bacterium]